MDPENLRLHEITAFAALVTQRVAMAQRLLSMAWLHFHIKNLATVRAGLAINFLKVKENDHG